MASGINCFSFFHIGTTRGASLTITSAIRAVRSSPIFPATAMSGFEVEAAVPSSRAEVAFWPIVDVGSRLHEGRLKGLSGPSANRRPISAHNSKRPFRCYSCQVARGRATGKRQRKQSRTLFGNDWKCSGGRGPVWHRQKPPSKSRIPVDCPRIVNRSNLLQIVVGGGDFGQ